MRPKLSITIVHHIGTEMLRNCLNSISTYPPSVPYEMIVLDNAVSTDAVQMLQTEFPQIRVLQNSERLGFGENQNCAMSEAKGEYILLLNDDTIALENSFNALYELWRHMKKWEFWDPNF